MTTKAEAGLQQNIIGIVTALPEERRAVLACAQQVRRQAVDSIILYEARLAEREICVVEGGMGTTAAADAAQRLLTARQPGLLISAGFCGALHPGPAVGDTVLCRNLLTHEEIGLIETALPGNDMATARLADTLKRSGITVWQGSFITTRAIVVKAVLAGTLPADLPTPVLEMESAAVAAVAAAAGVPFIGLRTVSDDAAEELGFTLDELTDRQFQISIPKVLVTCLKRPRIIPQLARLARNSAVAGKALGRALQQIMPLV